MAESWGDATVYSESTRPSTQDQLTSLMAPSLYVFVHSPAAIGREGGVLRRVIGGGVHR
jgi:hypothetical protein